MKEQELKPAIVYLGLGSNLGEREDNIGQAIHFLQQWVKPLLTSSVYETDPWGPIEQPNFLNCVLKAQTTLPPASLLAAVKEVEQKMGRKPSVRYGPRLIDVDILFYNDLIVEQPDLTIPQQGIPERAFVLVPMKELASEFVHPALNLTINQLFQQVEGKEGVRLWKPPFIFNQTKG